MKSSWTPGQVTSLAMAVTALGAIVVLTIYAEGRHVDALLALIAGLMMPSALPKGGPDAR